MKIDFVISILLCVHIKCAWLIVFDIRFLEPSRIILMMKMIIWFYPNPFLPNHCCFEKECFIALLRPIDITRCCNHCVIKKETVYYDSTVLY